MSGAFTLEFTTANGERLAWVTQRNGDDGISVSPKEWAVLRAQLDAGLAPAVEVTLDSQAAFDAWIGDKPNPPPPVPLRMYLGDGVYGSLDDGRLVLTTENGASVTNRIYLEEETLRALGQWLKKLGFHL
jgi:hypothetical protein